ncbi:MAG: hypothetical protein ABIC95_00105 [archaeon]
MTVDDITQDSGIAARDGLVSRIKRFYTDLREREKRPGREQMQDLYQQTPHPSYWQRTRDAWSSTTKDVFWIAVMKGLYSLSKAYLTTIDPYLLPLKLYTGYIRMPYVAGRAIYTLLSGNPSKRHVPGSIELITGVIKEIKESISYYLRPTPRYS